MTATPIHAHHDRIEQLLAEMTLEEKAGQLTQYFYFADINQGGAAASDGIDFAPIGLSEQPRMVEAQLAAGVVGSLLFVRRASETNRLQRLAIEGNRLGIPALFGFDVIHGLRTIMPVPIAMAASWDPATIERGQAVAAREARAVGIHWTFAPMCDVTRDPRWGRIIEGAGEDPVLGAAVAVAQVRGFRATDRALPAIESSPDRSTLPATGSPSVDAITTRLTSQRRRCGTPCCRRFALRSRPAPAT